MDSTHSYLKTKTVAIDSFQFNKSVSMLSTLHATADSAIYLRGGALIGSDSTSIRNYSNSLYLKNADSTTLKNSIFGNTHTWSVAQTFSNGIAFNNPSVTTGLGVLQKNNSSYAVTVDAGTTLSMFEFTKSNLDVTSTGHSEFIGLRVTTSDSCIDCGEAISIRNKGRADGLYVGVEGISGTPLSNSPTGIGIDLNRNGSNENSTTYTGYGMQIYDWSQTDEGTSGAKGIFIKKQNNPNTDHRLLFLQGNRNLLYLFGSGGAGFDSTKPVIEYDTTGKAFFVVNAKGYIGSGVQSPTVPFDAADVDGKGTSAQLTSYGAAGGTAYFGRASQGTSASPTATISGNGLVALKAGGHTGSAFTDTKAQIGMIADSGWDATHNGTRIDFQTTANDGTTLTQRMRINNRGNVSIGSTTMTSLFNVGSAAQFQVNSSGDIVKLNNVTTTFPSSNSSGHLQNNGSGTLTWNASDTIGLGAALAGKLSTSAKDTLSKGYTFDGGTAADSTIFWICDQSGITIDSILVYREGGTSASINVVRIRSGSSSDLISANFATASRTWLQTHENVGALQNNTLLKGDKLGFCVRAQSGTVTRFLMQINISKVQL